MSTDPNKKSSYFIPLILISSIFFGGLFGYFGGKYAPYIKPLGDIFINLLFTAIVPLIFFSIATAVARTGALGTLGRVVYSMCVVFIITGIIAACYALLIVMLYPPAEQVQIALNLNQSSAPINAAEQIVGIFTVSEFNQLLSHQHMLALIIFSVLVGLAVTQTQEKGQFFLNFLQAGEAIFMRVFELIMYYAPIGFFAYFAVLVHELGPQLMTHYLRITLLYYTTSLIYFALVYSAYAFFAGKTRGVKLFWSHSLIPMLTALATCSSAACIPANLVASKKMNVPDYIADTTIPLGSLIHKDGSVIGGMFKIAFLFGLFHMDFTGASVLLPALGVSLLVGTVMGAIPSGGMLGELLILNVYGFPPSVLIAIAAISILIDPLATMLNVTGNTVSSMLIARMNYDIKRA